MFFFLEIILSYSSEYQNPKHFMIPSIIPDKSGSEDDFSRYVKSLFLRRPFL